MVYVNLTTEFR